MSTKKIWYAANQFDAYGQEEIDAVVECLKKGTLAGFGEKTKLFESKVSHTFGKKYGLFVNSGSSANLLALLSLGLEKGSEVITPACTFATTVAPIIQAGLTPVFCDVEINTYVPSVQMVLEKISDKTKVIMLPNLIGNKPDWILLRELLNMSGKKIVLIEDSCDTMTWTDTSDISTTSFYASHLITAGGSGGMVMFNDQNLLKIATMYRDWGRMGDNGEDIGDRLNYSVDGIPYDWKFLYKVIGYNFKSSEMNAAFGLVQLEKLEKIKAKRRSLIERYKKNLKNCQSYILPDDSSKPDWLAFPLIYKGDRKMLMNHLENNNVQTRVCFSGNITKHPAFQEYKKSFLNSDTIMESGILVGCHVGMTEEDVDRVCTLLLEKDITPTIGTRTFSNVFDSLSVSPSNIILNKDSIVVAITSVIEMSATPILGHSSRTVFTPQERFEQTVAQLKSVKEKIPNATTILLDGSISLSLPMIEELSRHANYVILFRDNLSALTYCHKSYRNKGLGELYKTSFLLSLLRDKEYAWFCKFNGRSVFSPEFSIETYKVDCPVVKCIKWKGKLGILAFTNFYSMPRRLTNHYAEHLKTWLSPDTDEPIEHILTFFLESVRGTIKIVDRLFIEGKSSVTGILQEL